MAKTIKFNLICDGKPVRTIEDLQNNFSMEDVLAYYDNQLLHRWLRVRGYDRELKEVSDITSKEPMDIIKELIRIFDVETDEKKVEESIYMLKFLEERRELNTLYEQENFKGAHIIDDYRTGYLQLVDGILDHPNDAAIIKANIAEIVSNYSWAMELNHRDLFWKLAIKSSLLAIMCLLMNDETRKYYLPVIDHEEENGKKVCDVDCEGCEDKKEMYECICELIQQDRFSDALGENLTTFTGATHQYWKNLEPKGKRCMIIQIGNGDYVRSAGETGGDLSYNDTRNQFVIVDGVDYESNSIVTKLQYMEV